MLNDVAKALHNKICAIYITGCQPSELALVPNVTSAMNSVIKSLDIKQDNVIYFLNVTYGT